MRKILFSIALGTMVLSSAAAAETMSPGYSSKGDCQQALNTAKWNALRGLPSVLAGVADPRAARCEKTGALWYIVV